MRNIIAGVCFCVAIYFAIKAVREMKEGHIHDENTNED